MARVLIRTQAWGTVTSRAGDALPNLSYALKNTDGSAATHWSAETGGSSSTSTLTTDVDGGAVLSSADRWIEAGEYDLTVNGKTYRVHTSATPVLYASSYGATGDGVTDDTAAVNLAITDAAALAPSNGSVDVVLPAGHEFLFGSQLIAKPGVRMWCHGAAIIPNWASIGNKPLISGQAATVLSNFAIAGGAWQGTGAETGTQFLFGVGTTITGGHGTGVQSCRFVEMDVESWATCILYMADPYRVQVLNNRLINVCTQGSTNAINFVATDNTNPTGRLHAIGNVVEGAVNASIAFVASAGVTAPIDVNAVFNDNVCIGSSGAVSGSIGGSIDIENATSNLISGFIVEGNHVNVPSSTAGVWAINIGNAAIGGVKVRGNYLEGAAGSVGVHTVSNDVEIANNTILTPNKIGGTGTPAIKSGNHYAAGGLMQGRATLVAGTVTVSTTEVVANDSINLTVVTPGGTRGMVQVGTIVAGTSFVINSVQPGTASTVQTSDTSTVFWKIEH